MRGVGRGGEVRVGGVGNVGEVGEVRVGGVGGVRK